MEAMALYARDHSARTVVVPRDLDADGLGDTFKGIRVVIV